MKALDDEAAAAAGRRSIRRVLTAVSLVAFATALFTRAVDPIIPPIAYDLAVDPSKVALLTTAFSIPYALIQPALGPVADRFGKTRVMMVCLVVLIATALASALATRFEALLLARVVAGMAAGGVFPVSLAIIGDLVPVAERQVALGRYIAIVVSGNFLGTTLAGVVGDLVGWRGVFAAVGICGVVAFVTAYLGFRRARLAEPVRHSTQPVLSVFAAIFANPRAQICYAVVFLEGIAVLGLSPYVALMLFAGGETRAAIAGLVLSGFALGGIAYSLMVRALLRRFSQSTVMGLGGGIAALGLAFAGLGATWPLMMLDFGFIGLGFYMFHGCIQVQATEIAPGARGAAMALHSFFFFLGQAIGPVFYGIGLVRIGAFPTTALGAALVGAVGLSCARWLGEKREAV